MAYEPREHLSSAAKGRFARLLPRLQDEFGFRPVIVGGAEAGALAGELASRRIPVLFSVAFDTPADWDPEDESEMTPAAAREKERLVPIGSRARGAL